MQRQGYAPHLGIFLIASNPTHEDLRSPRVPLGPVRMSTPLSHNYEVNVSQDVYVVK